MSIYKTYSADREIFRKLGLEPFETGDSNEIEVGRVAIGMDGSYVDVFVSCYPAQFWRFVIYRAESKETLELTTGSGTLQEYWPAVNPFARGMANMTKLVEAALPEPAVLALVPDGPRTRLSPLT